MFELVGCSVSPFVAIKGIQPSSSKCEACGQGEIYYLPKSGSLFFSYLPLANLPKPVRSCFAVGSDGHLQLCMTPARWGEIVGRPGTKQLRSGLIAVLNEKDVERNPKMEIRTKEYLARQKRKSSARQGK